MAANANVGQENRQKRVETTGPTIANARAASESLHTHGKSDPIDSHVCNLAAANRRAAIELAKC